MDIASVISFFWRRPWLEAQGQSNFLAVSLLETSSTISFQFTIFQGTTLHVRNFLTLYITLED